MSNAVNVTKKLKIAAPEPCVKFKKKLRDERRETWCALCQIGLI